MHSSLLQSCIKHGLNVFNTIKTLKFEQEAYIKPYMKKNAEIRRDAKKTFREHLEKLLKKHLEYRFFKHHEMYIIQWCNKITLIDWRLTIYLLLILRHRAELCFLCVAFFQWRIVVFSINEEWAILLWRGFECIFLPPSHCKEPNLWKKN